MKKILIIDDESDIREIIMTYLSEVSSYKVCEAEHPNKGIEKLKTEKYDLVITDMIMPDLNGIELTEYILKNYPQTKVLACSGGGDSGKLVAGLALDQAIEEGANNALLKPFTKEQLMTKVKTLIGD